MRRAALPEVVASLWLAGSLACGRADAPSTAAPVARPAAPPAAPSLATTHPVRRLTGARTRVVWVQDQGDGTDVFARGNRLVLMGLDTDDGRGERVLRGTPGSYAKPLVTRRGDRIVYSDRVARKVFVTDWRGATPRPLVDGFALATWIDPVSHTEWVYYGSYAGQREPDSYAAVWRVALDQPARRELVWDRTPIGEDNFQLSADGRRAAAMFPWPHSGIATLPNLGWRKVADGCWTALAPDNSSRFFYLDGAHRHVLLVDPETAARRRIRLNDIPGGSGGEIYHPRWSNDPRFLTVTGPYTLGDDTNRVKGGGPGVEVFVGRFTPGFDRIEAWVQVTRNGRADFLPDVWIDPHEAVPGDAPGSRPAPPRVGEPTPRSDVRTPAAPSPPVSSRLVVDARLVEASRIPTPAAIAPYHRALVAHRYRVVRVVAGQFTGSELLAAHWVIVDRRVLPTAVRQVGAVYRLTLDPYDARPDLEGERLTLDSDALDLPLFYDVGSAPPTRGR